MIEDQRRSKVSIITLHNSPNYGSCLQTYATQTVLAGLGCTPEIIDYYREDAIPDNEVERALNGQLAKKMPIFKIPGVKAIARIPVGRMVKRRSEPLNAFRDESLMLSPRKYYSSKELEDNPPQADIYCTGSDQVWNSTWNGGFNKPFYLTFAPKGAKKIAYAASIGKDSLEEWEKEPMRAALAEYSHISVREERAAELLDSIGIHSVPVVDPTLMLDADAWGEVAARGRIPKQPYILIYQLNKNREFDEYAKKLSEKLGLPLYRIAYGIHEKRRGENAIVCPAVEEFVSLFQHASYVVTDSFHGTVFSMNFSKKFVAISPGRFSGRIMNLLEMTGESNHYLTDYRDFESVDSTIDYDLVHKVFAREQARATEFLQLALND